MKKFLTGLMLAAVLTAQVSAQAVLKKNSPAQKAAENITAAQLKDYLYYVASDEMEGRDTPSKGLDLTAKFMATMLSRWGFKPAGDNGTFFQKIALRSSSINAANTKLSINGTDFTLNEDFYRTTGNTSTGNLPMVFGGDGWMLKSKNIDALANVDVKGKIVVFAGTSQNFTQRYIIAPPSAITPDDLKGKRGEDWADPIKNAQDKGAAGIILIAPQQLLSVWGDIRSFFSRGSMMPEKLIKPNSASPTTIPVMIGSTRIREAIFGGNVPQTAGNLDKTANLQIDAAKTETLWTQNVVALWEGSDPNLKNEMVAVGAHYDHVGVNPNAKGDDKIWNGADDDGSGTVAVLSMAEALAKAPKRPKRSILLVWHVGEEKGLWGSEYFNKFPTVDIKNVVAQLNIDMIGRSRAANNTDPRNNELSDPNTIYTIGSQMMSTKLGEVADSVNKGYLKMTYDKRYDDPNDKNRFFFRSDHFNYALNGIPVVFWFDGVHEDYHQAGDEPEKIDYNKMQSVTRTIFLTMWEIADLKERPKVDKELPAELRQR